MNKKIIYLVLGVTFVFSIFSVLVFSKFIIAWNEPAIKNIMIGKELVPKEIIKEVEEQKHPMAIQSLRDREFEEGDFLIEEKLPNGRNYQQFIASYQSEGLKIYGLLTVPLAEKPKNGFPAVIFIHGYIPPKEYSTTKNYPTYQARLASNGFVTFKPDLRGHGNSEGTAVSAHFSEKYVVDTLYAIAYLKKYGDVDPKKIVYWGHSNGGEIGLRVITISKDIKAASFWAGVVGSYKDMFETYNDKISFLRNASSESLVLENKLPSENPNFWNQLDPYYYLNEVNTPIQLHHGTNDESVPLELSISLKTQLEKLAKPAEFFEYSGDDHNLSKNVNLAFQRTIDFYNQSLLDQENTLHEPISSASKRITKKSFGLKVSPTLSPVQPEKFSGYHTGVDFEIFPGEENEKIDVLAMCPGPIILKRQVSGYGGVIAQQCEINNESVSVIYGHLNLDSTIKNLNQNLTQGEKIGILGQGFSTETDGERKHLHLGIYRGKDVNLLGYVKSTEELKDWIDYQTLIK